MEPLNPSPAFAATTADQVAVDDGYHDNLLIVVARREAASFAAVPAFHTLGAAENNAPGLGRLSILEQMGAIRHVYPLARSAFSAGVKATSLGVVGQLATAAAEPENHDPLAGASIVELTSSSDLPATLQALAEDPHVESASRVPVRHLVDNADVLAEGSLPLETPPGMLTWNLAKIGWQAARSSPGFVEADRIRIAVLDTGIDDQHPDLQDAIASYVHRYDHPIAPVHLSDRDIEGHGAGRLDLESALF